MPSLGTYHEPVALRAGPGVRIHGYGGIQTLERLPVPPDDVTRALRTASLAVEVKRAARRAVICGSNRPIFEEFVVVAVTTVVAENGGFTNTYTFTGDIQYFDAVDDELDPCPAPDFSTTFDPEFDYGDTISEDTEYTVVTYENLAEAAIADLPAVASVADVTGSWLETDWKTVSENSIEWVSVSALRYLGGAVITDPFTHARATGAEWRIRNTGAATIRVQADLQREDTAEILDTLDLTLARGQVSSWQTPPLSGDYLVGVRFNRVRIGPWQFIA